MRASSPAQAQTKTGLFKVHRIGERVLFEIPRRELNKDILLVQEIAQTTLGAGYGGQAAGNRVLRFERRDNRVLLRGISYEIVASDTRRRSPARCRRRTCTPVIAIFNVEAYGPDSAPVIDVSRLFTTAAGGDLAGAAHRRRLHDRRDALVDRARRRRSRTT